MNKHALQLTALFTLLVVAQAEAVQDVYEYKNKKGVTEFTDQAKDGKVPEKQFQIQKRTPEEEAQSKEKLEHIMEKDKELDKRLAEQRRLENERIREYQEQQALKRQQELPVQDDDHYSRRNKNWRPGVPIRPVEPGKPGHPIAKPKPKSKKKAAGK